jgi:amino acid adenylation domain-containing protein
MTSLRRGALVDRLLGYANADPDGTAIADGTGRLARAEWDRRARIVAAGLRPGTRVLILLPSGTDFFVAFAGVLYAGAAAVPAPPSADGRFVDVAMDAEIDAIVTTSAIAAMARRAWADRDVPRVRWLELDRIVDAGHPSWSPPNIGPDDLALVQYTSGSTGTPKGVAVSHEVLAAWLDVLGDRVDLPPGSSVVTWVTAHHVLGLSLVLLASHLGGAATLLSTEDVMAEPLRWLRAVSAAERPVVSGAPPFGYQHCLDAIAPEQRSGLDLSGWEVAVIGSERISPTLLDEFTAAYQPHGFRKSAFFTGYGNTEAMMVAAHRGPPEPIRLTVDAAELEHRRVRPATGGRTAELVACGTPGVGIEMVIVDPESRWPVAANQVGELWMRGDPIADGYWRRPERTEQTFRAELADGTGPYLRSGDLAFFHGDEVVVCGRLNELIIIRGRNLLPDEVESTVRSADPALADVPVAAFSVAGERGEHLVVLATAPDGIDPRELARRIRTAVIAGHEVEPHAVHIVTPESIPLTATGKVRRAACRTALLDNRLPVLASATASPIRASGSVSSVRQRVAAVLGEPESTVALDRPLIQLGLDSMRMIRLRADLGLSVPMDQLAGHTVTTLAAEVAAPNTPAEPTTVTPDPARRHEPFALTELQHAYLVGRSGGYQLGGVGTHFYAEFDTTGLDPDRLYAAWCRLVERHDMLRAVIRADGDQHVQSTVEIPPLDVRDHTDSIRARMSHQVFQPDEWPLFDIRVSRLPNGTDRVHVSLDLLVLDVWSLHILSREWRLLYDEPRTELPRLDLTFRDYVCAAGDAVDPGRVERATRYWQDRLDTLPGGPELPLRCAPAALTGPPRFVRRSGRLDPARWTRLTEQAVAAGLTPTSVLLAAYATVLGGWTRRSRFVLNLPTFNRLPIHPDVGAIVGDFTSLTLLEVDLTGAGSIVELAARLQAQLWQDLDHHEYDGVRVLRELARRRGPDALAPVVFSSASGQTADEMPLSWLGDPVFGVSQTPQVLLDHQVVEHAGGLDFNWDTVDELFADDVVDDMFTAYRTLIDRLADGSGWDDSLRTPLPAAQARMVEAANATDGELPDGMLFSGIAEQARRTPDRPAVLAADRDLTFGQLWGHATALAARLRDAGVQRNQLVGVCLPKGPAQVVAVLGVLLSGGAYLPVDPSLPLARRHSLVALGRCHLAVGETEWPAGVTSVPLDFSAPPAAIDLPDEPAALAYVIFTSGSTGEPKGVAVSHRAALNTCVDVCERFEVGPDDRVLGLSSLSFDLSVWDIFGVLGVGGALVLPEPQARRDPARWWDLVRRHRVTVWNSVPALAGMFTEYAYGRENCPLRLAMLSGDWIPLDLPQRIRDVAPDCRVVSLGGATEAAIWSIHYEVREIDPSWESIPYGWPLRNQRCHVLNERWQECPVGVTGELFIAGTGLAEGYFGDQDRTDASFVTHPATGERLYRTGDLGRRRPDGTIEFLGREDFQVKVGGHRIELGEIESALLAHPAVRSAVVAAVGDRHHRRLAACVVTGHDGPRGGMAIAPEFFGAADRQQMIFDEIDRVDFKLARHGVRTDLTNPPVPLPAADDRVPTRASHRRYADRPVPLADLAGLLARLRSHDGPAMPKYAYASAGNAYAVQTYVYVPGDRISGLACGIYYHDPVGHRLVPVGPDARLSSTVSFGIDQLAVDTAAFMLFFVAALPAIRPLYGDRAARDLCLIEAGLMAQLLESDATAHRIGLCQLTVVGGADVVRESCGLGDDHEIVHAMLGGALLRTGETPRPEDSTDRLADDIRAHLVARLPNYMVPPHIATVEQLPLTPTGKVDRTAVERLVATDGRRVDTSPPATELEARIAEIFQQVLGLDTVGVHAGFFDLGADSTAIVRAYRLLKQKLDRAFPLTAMFEHATVRKLATALSGADPTNRAELFAVAERRAQLARSARRRRGTDSPSREGVPQ